MSDKIGHIEKASVAQVGLDNSDKKEETSGGVFSSIIDGKNKAIKGFVNNKGMFVGIILVFIVILAFTTNINFTATTEIIRLSLVVFIFMFCSYSMYVNCADSGTRAGKNTSLYTKTKAEYDAIKKRIVAGNNQIYLGDFCRWYIENELQHARKDVLESVGIDYQEYQKRWVGADKKTIKSNNELSKREKDAIISANEIKPVKLTQEMLLKRERGNKRRAPLGVSPKAKRRTKYSIKLITTVSTSIFTCMLALDVISNPSWATFAELCIKLLFVVLSGFTGYKMGYENITIDTVDYILDQTDLLVQFEEYLETFLKTNAVEGSCNEEAMGEVCKPFENINQPAERQD